MSLAHIPAVDTANPFLRRLRIAHGLLASSGADPERPAPAGPAVTRCGHHTPVPAPPGRAGPAV